MKQSALLEFESTAFAITPDEDAETNPGIFGKALAEWLAHELRATGFDVAESVSPEDFGWCVEVADDAQRLYVACSNVDGTHDRWLTFAFAEGGLLRRLLGRSGASSLDPLFEAVHRALASNADVREMIRRDS